MINKSLWTFIVNLLFYFCFYIWPWKLQHGEGRDGSWLWLKQGWGFRLRVGTQHRTQCHIGELVVFWDTTRLFPQLRWFGIVVTHRAPQWDVKCGRGYGGATSSTVLSWCQEWVCLYQSITRLLRAGQQLSTLEFHNTLVILFGEMYIHINLHKITLIHKSFIRPDTLPLL